MKFKKVYIVTGEGKDLDGSVRRALLEIIRENGATEVSEPQQAELLTVLGGDGTIMHASHIAQELDIPLIGINLGRIGYLADLEKDNLHRFADVLAGNCTEEKRMMLSVSVGAKSYVALNDAVIHAEKTHIAHLSLFCNGQPVNKYSADGIICATATGSTAYSMSAGGAAVDPRLECICVTPLCCQSLSARPLIFAPDSKLTLRCEKGRPCILTIDGSYAIPISAGDESEVTVEKSPRHLRLLKTSSDEFYTVLTKKLYI